MKSLFFQGLGRDPGRMGGNVEQGVVWPGILRMRQHFMFEQGTYNAKVFKEDVLGSVCRREDRAVLGQWCFRVQ